MKQARAKCDQYQVEINDKILFFWKEFLMRKLHYVTTRNMKAVLNYKGDRYILFCHFMEGNYFSNSIIIKYLSKTLAAINEI